MSRDRTPDKTADDRDSRRGAALRANLARRKAQARTRAAADATETTTNDRRDGTSSPDSPASEG